MRWENLLDSFGHSILEALGEDPYYLPTDHNPITQALKDSQFIEKYGDMPGFSRASLARAAVLCQMVIFDASGGPDEDGDAKALRRHWYQYFKTEFAQPLAHLLGDVTINAQGVAVVNDLAWTQRLSTTYAYFVDRCGVTYKDLWVKDASRMMESFWDVLFRGCHIVLCVEKDSLFDDFIAAAKALGAKAAYSGKGKTSKAATEKLLRDAFGWRKDYDPFSFENPLIIIHLSDFDFDGEAVIGPTFGEQARRYTQWVVEARIGIEPKQVTNEGLELPDKWYIVKTSNNGYVRWAERQALYHARCECGHVWAVQGINGHYCPVCQSPVELDARRDDPHGLEVEALKTRDYYGLVVTALLEVLPIDYIIDKLRDECVANSYDAAREVTEDVLAQNPDYQRLLQEFDRLNEIKQEFEDQVRDELEAVAAPHEEDWRDDDDDPTEEDFQKHVVSATDYTGPWRPFRKSDRTAELVKWLREEAEDTIQELAAEPIEW